MSPRVLLQRAATAVERTAVGIYIHHGFDHAAAMTFYFFLSLFPLLAFLGFALSRAALGGALEPVLSRLYVLMPDSSARFIQEDLDRMASSETSLAPLSLIVFLYLTSSGAHNTMDLLEVATGAPPRRWVRQRAVAILYTAGIVLSVALTAWLLVVAGSTTNDARHLAERLLHISLDRATAAALIIVAAVAGVAALALFYRIAVMRPSGVDRKVWPGALTAVVLFGLVTWGFGVWVRTLGRYAVYYGGLAAFAVLLIWLYLGSLALLIGAEVNAQLEGLRPRYSLRR